MRASAEQLRTFVDQVLASTGADKVDLIGHSQGTPDAPVLRQVPRSARRR